MSGPCLCGDIYCPSCGSQCPKCDDVGFLQLKDNPDLYRRCSCNMTPEEETEYLEFMRGDE